MDNTHLDLRRLSTNIKNKLIQLKVDTEKFVNTLKKQDKSLIKNEYNDLFSQYERLKQDENIKLIKLNEDKKILNENIDASISEIHKIDNALEEFRQILQDSQLYTAKRLARDKMKEYNIMPETLSQASVFYGEYGKYGKYGGSRTKRRTRRRTKRQSKSRK